MITGLGKAIELARQGQYKELADIVYQINKSNGYWDKERSSLECATLCASEIFEALEAYRKERYTKIESIEADTDADYKQSYELLMKDTFQAELAGTVIRALDWMGHVKSYHSANSFDFTELMATKDVERLGSIALGILELKHWPQFAIASILKHYQNHNIWAFVDAEIRYNAVRGTKQSEGKIA